MTVTAIDLLIQLLGGEIPTGNKEVKEAYATNLALEYLHENNIELSELDGKTLDQLAEMVDKILPGDDLTNQQSNGKQNLNEGSTKPQDKILVTVELPHAVTILVDTKPLHLKAGTQQVSADVADDLVEEGIIKNKV